MAYKERGRIFTKLPMQSGTNGQGKSWQKMDVVVETEDARFPKKIAVTFFNDKADMLTNLNNNDLVDFSFVVESREYQGRWFSNVNGLSIDAVVGDGSDNSLKGLRPDDINLPPEDDGLPF
jgi:hypothetical protein